MENIKYKEGDRVRIKSLDWYNENKDEDGDVSCREYDFVSEMSVFCGKILTIDVDFEDETYLMKEDIDGFVFTSEMIEGLAEDESSIDLTVKGEEVKERIEIKIPEGYEYVIESGKIIFTKKKSKYPTNYIECYEVMYGKKSPFHSPQVVKNIGYKGDLFTNLQRLIFYRDAYWKIAGEEMGLGKPWEPDWENKEEEKYTIEYFAGMVHKDHYSSCSRPFAFPTEEMRDVFYENFKEDIEICKEFL